MRYLRIDKRLTQTALLLLSGLLTYSAGMAQVYTDDTEILTSITPDIPNPNVLFIIDTSGSMNVPALIDIDAYDPSLPDYSLSSEFCPGSTAQFDPNKFYLQVTYGGFTNVPQCDDENAGLFELPIDFLAMNKCNALEQALATQGHWGDGDFYIWDDADALPRWKAGYLGFNSITGERELFGNYSGVGNPPHMECSTDAGVHGNDVAGSYYMVNNPSAPWVLDTDTSDSALPTGAITALGGRGLIVTGHFLNWARYQHYELDSPISKRRAELVADAVDTILHSVSNINIGVMRFSTNSQGGSVGHEIVPLSSTNDVGEPMADVITDIVDSWQPNGGTPLAETLFEAYQYFSGGQAYYGASATPASSENSMASGNYIAPTFEECQKNHIVLLTDGDPTVDWDADSLINNLPGITIRNDADSYSGNDAQVACAASGQALDVSCLDDLSHYMASIDFSSSVPGLQNVVTHTMGLDIPHAEDFLTEVATAPDGYHNVQNPSEIVTAFQNIIESIQVDIGSFTPPAISVNSYNRLYNNDEMYFAFFKPRETTAPRWSGNLKKYRLGLSEDERITILDANDKAIMDADGNIKDTAQSFWSDSIDGGDLLEGGMSEALRPDRKIFTNVLDGANATSSGDLLPQVPSISNNDLGMLLDPNNTVPINKNGDLGSGMSADDVDRYRAWIKGEDPEAPGAGYRDVRERIGDALHSTPLVLPYLHNEEIIEVVFFMTNDGYLHALEAESGRELFAYVPGSLMQRVPELADNTATTGRSYGLDGSMSTLIVDDDNMIVDGSESAYLYFGMRRGGRDYYALDVSDILGATPRPRLQWVIEGGEDPFEGLGQSWSKPTPGKIFDTSGDLRDVIFFAGGNDTNKDAKDPTGSIDTMGNTIYVVDATSGLLLSPIGSIGGARSRPDQIISSMTHAIPSDLAIFDVNSDGATDRIYVGDTGGQLLRFDIRYPDSAAPEFSGGVIARFGNWTDNDESNDVSVYYPPSVSFNRRESGSYLAIGVGTGQRSHPLDTDVRNYLYVVNDKYVFGPELDDDGDPTYSQYDDFNNVRQLWEEEQTSIGQENPFGLTYGFGGWNYVGGDREDGWYLPLITSGEKVLAPAVSAIGRIMFTTYVPTIQAETDPCSPLQITGSGRVYTLDIKSGKPIDTAAESQQDNGDNTDTNNSDTGLGDLNFGNDAAATNQFAEGVEIPFVELTSAGIPPQALLMFMENVCNDNTCLGDNLTELDEDFCEGSVSQVVAVIGKETYNPNICNTPGRTYWYQSRGNE